MTPPPVSQPLDEDRWLAVLEALGRIPSSDRPALRAAMADVVARAGTDAMSGTSAATFARHVALCVADGDDIITRLQQIHAADLALALRCAQGVPDAVSTFRRRFSSDAERVVAKYPELANDRSDAVQILLERLLVVRPDAPARIADYRGRGPLQGWVRVAALRIGVDLVRARAAKREVLAGAPLHPEQAAAETSVRTIEDRYVQHVFGGAVRESIEAAFAKLTARERNLLRHNVVQGLTIDQIAPIYGVHRATAARWLERARKNLGTAARDVLMERHGVAASDVHSVMRCVDSQVDLSIGRLLG